MRIIEINWSGAFKLDQALSAYTDIDYGLYVIYGTHNISGTDTLLYIGKVEDRNFGQRISEHKNDFLDWDFPEFTIYFGHFGAENFCLDDEWNSQINDAEKILIDFCQPPYNSQGLKGLLGKVDDNTIIFNWGKRHKLPFEVSTIWMQTSKHKGVWNPFSNLHNK